MKSYMNKGLYVCLFVLSALGLLSVPLFTDNASAQPPCNVEICKIAPQLPPSQSEDDLVFFDFTEIRNGSENDFSLAANERCTGGSYDVGESAEIVEVPLEGWKLLDVECSNSPGISTALIENGVSVRCVSEGFISCTFTNVRVPVIPTLSEWGMIAAAAGLALVGVFFAVRRKRMQDA